MDRGSELPGAVKGACFCAAERTLDGEDSSEMVTVEERFRTGFMQSEPGILNKWVPCETRPGRRVSSLLLIVPPRSSDPAHPVMDRPKSLI